MGAEGNVSAGQSELRVVWATRVRARPSSSESSLAGWSAGAAAAALTASPSSGLFPDSSPGNSSLGSHPWTWANSFSHHKDLTFHAPVTLGIRSELWWSVKRLKLHTCRWQSLLLWAVCRSNHKLLLFTITESIINHLANNRRRWIQLLKCVVTHYGSEGMMGSHSEAGVSWGVILQLLAVFDKDEFNPIFCPKMLLLL